MRLREGGGDFDLVYKLVHLKYRYFMAWKSLKKMPCMKADFTKKLNINRKRSRQNKLVHKKIREELK